MQACFFTGFCHGREEKGAFSWNAEWSFIRASRPFGWTGRWFPPPRTSPIIPRPGIIRRCGSTGSGCSASGYTPETGGSARSPVSGLLARAFMWGRAAMIFPRWKRILPPLRGRTKAVIFCPGCIWTVLFGGSGPSRGAVPGQYRGAAAPELCLPAVAGGYGRALCALMDFVERSPWKDQVVGYQVAAGNTEEWMYHRHHELQLCD